MARRKRRGHGFGNVWQRGRGNWAVRWRENGRRCYKDGFDSRELAERVLAKIRGDLATGRAGLAPDVKNTPTLATLADPFFKGRKLTHRAGAEDGYRWNKHLAPHIGHLKPSE